MQPWLQTDAIPDMTLGWAKGGPNRERWGLLLCCCPGGEGVELQRNF